jgi:hypothetical protein
MIRGGTAASAARSRTRLASDTGTGLGAWNHLNWKLSAKYKQLEVHGFNPDSEVNCKAEFDALKYELGVVQGDRNWVFGAFDGKIVYELLKLKDKYPGEYDWLEPLRFPLHEHMNDMKTYVGVYWDSVLAPLAAQHGFSNPIILQKASNTHKCYDFLLLVYESLLIGFVRQHLNSQLRRGVALAACTPFTTAMLREQLNTTTDDTFLWRFGYAFLDLQAVIGRKRARRDDNQERIDAYNRLVMPMYEVNDHKFYTKMNVWYQMREQQLHPQFLCMKHAAESHQFKLLLRNHGTRSHAQDIKPEYKQEELKDIPRTRRHGPWVGIDDITECFGRRIKRSCGFGVSKPARTARESILADGELRRREWMLGCIGRSYINNLGTRKTFPRQEVDRKNITGFLLQPGLSGRTTYHSSYLAHRA